MKKKARFNCKKIPALEQLEEQKVLYFSRLISFMSVLRELEQVKEAIADLKRALGIKEPQPAPEPPEKPLEAYSLEELLEMKRLIEEKEAQKIRQRVKERVEAERAGKILPELNPSTLQIQFKDLWEEAIRVKKPVKSELEKLIGKKLELEREWNQIVRERREQG